MRKTEKMTKIKSNQKGITLIALVITIIVLLILAGVAISMLSGENGILKQAAAAQEKTSLAEEDELSKLDVYESTIRDHVIVENGIIKNTTKDIEYSSIKEAIEDSTDNDIIEISGGEYNLIEELDLSKNGSAIVIDKSITIRAINSTNKPIFKLANSNGTTVPAIINGIEIKADNVTMKNIVFKVTEGKPSSGNLVKISPEDASSNDFYENIVIDGCEFYGSDHSIEIYAKDAKIKNCIFDESKALDQGNIMVIRGVTGSLEVTNNRFVGDSQKKHAISFYGETNNYIQGDILFESNIFNQVYKCIVHESTMTYDNVSVEIKNNTFSNYKKKAVAIDKGTFSEYLIKNNVFDASIDGTVIIDNGIEFNVDANNNYWGSSPPDKAAIFEGNVNATNYYTNKDKSDIATW